MADVEDIGGNNRPLRRPGDREAAGDRELAALAARQHGVVGRRQMLALGVSASAIRYKLRVGRLHRVHAGVYSVGYARISGLGRWMAATLALGPTAMLSHGSAAALWGIDRSTTATTHVSVEGRSRRRQAGIVVHRPRSLHPDERAAEDGIPVTSVARTLLDVTETWPIRRVRRAFEEAERLRLLDRRKLEAVRSRAHGRHGLAVFTGLLAEHHEPHLTRSELERRFLGLCADHGLPPPSVNGLVLGHEVDFHWPGRRLMVEVDGYAFHRTRASFERDRARDAALHAAGYLVLRLTDRRLENGAEAAMGQVRQLLAVA